MIGDSERPASETGRLFQPCRSFQKAVRRPTDSHSKRSVQLAIRDGEAAAGGDGRLLIRKSGTEPVIRIMAEGEDEVLVLQVVDEIARAIEVAGRG